MNLKKAGGTFESAEMLDQVATNYDVDVRSKTSTYDVDDQSGVKDGGSCQNTEVNNGN